VIGLKNAIQTTDCVNLSCFINYNTSVTLKCYYFCVTIFYFNLFLGETYKLRASNTRERQAWVDRIRHVGQVIIFYKSTLIIYD
jgi:hypothetical protein